MCAHLHAHTRTHTSNVFSLDGFTAHQGFTIVLKHSPAITVAAGNTDKPRHGPVLGYLNTYHTHTHTFHMKPLIFNFSKSCIDLLIARILLNASLRAFYPTQLCMTFSLSHTHLRGSEKNKSETFLVLKSHMNDADSFAGKSTFHYLNRCAVHFLKLT